MMIPRVLVVVEEEDEDDDKEDALLSRRRSKEGRGLASPRKEIMAGTILK